MNLEGTVAVVTGGAKGNGKGIVDVFVSRGAKVAILDYSEELRNVINELAAKGYDICGYKVDIREKDKVDFCINKIAERYGKIDILVNNAGVCYLETFEKTTDEIRDYHFDINIKGTWNVTKSVIPYMQKNKKGSIINLSSVTGPCVADPGEVAYATSKAAVLGFTKSLAAELVKYNIRVNAIMPGYVKTPMVDGMAKESNVSDPLSVVEKIASSIPMGRLALPEEIGELAAFLSSSEASYITGQGIVIDGGSTLPETIAMGV